ncbi:hypothetical protein ACIBG8_19585 [Nonomuraea sp. NPDC050556]|uniref:hypothetical protein n=1 Tax=Nonomuraea sp. NPDC050556 TaxID=3364369 RepID=UPI0037883BA8
MLLVDVPDIEARSGRSLTGADLAKALAYIADVSALIESYLRRTYTSPGEVPGVVKAICCLEVQRFMNTDPGVANDRVGDLSTMYADGGSVVALSVDARVALRPFRAGGGIGTIRLYSHLLPPLTAGGTP